MEVRRNGLAALDLQILDAYALGDEPRLARLYWDAAQQLHADARTDEACFFAVQAYALALSAGRGEATEIRSFLRGFGREK